MEQYEIWWQVRSFFAMVYDQITIWGLCFCCLLEVSVLKRDKVDRESYKLSKFIRQTLANKLLWKQIKGNERYDDGSVIFTH